MSGTADPKPVRQADESDAQARLDFRVAVLATDGGCVLHDDPADCELPVQAHHVVSQQTLRRAGRSDLAWDPRNGVAVCEGPHRRHTRAIERLPVSRLPDRCIAFAVEHGFAYVLDREYAPAR